MSEADSAADTREPTRYIDKQEAIRHLIHAAIRLMQKQEGPFAIHPISSRKFAPLTTT